MHLNGFKRGLIFFWFIVLSLVGLFALKNSLPIKPIHLFELLIVAIVLLSVNNIEKPAVPIFIVSSTYLVFSLWYAVELNGVHILDFLLAYKIFIYLPLLAFLTNERFFSRSSVEKLFILLLITFFVKYSSDQVFSISSRPVVFRENNYELMFLAVMFYLYTFFTPNRKPPILVLLLVLAIFFLSGSRSALAILMAIIVLIYFKDIKSYSIIPAIFIFLISLVTFLLVFFDRMDERGVESIDRLRFFLVFVSETNSWSFINYLIGAERISALSEYGCHSLKDYPDLFSFKEDGSCYSVIFHSYILRVIYDHGIIGFLFILFAVYKLLSLKGYPKKFIFATVIVFLLNALSVSSFNSVFFALSMVVLLGVNKTEIQNVK